MSKASMNEGYTEYLESLKSESEDNIMIWEYSNKATADNIYDEIVTTFKAKSEDYPLIITVKGHYRHKSMYQDENGNKIRDDWYILDKYFVYKGFRVTYEYIKYADGTGKDCWTVRSVPVDNSMNMYRDKIFNTLNEVVNFINSINKVSS